MTPPVGVRRVALNPALVFVDQRVRVVALGSFGDSRQLLPDGSGGSLCGGEPRRAFLTLGNAVAADFKPANDPGQREAIDEERDHDDARREQDNELAERKRRTRSGYQRNRQCSRERHRAANPRPSDQKYVARVARSFPLADVPKQPEWKISGGKNPDDPEHDHHCRDREREQRQAGSARVGYSGDHRVQLHAQE